MTEDHPRMCGKDSKSKNMTPNFLGSPPHVRERLPPLMLWVTSLGITPACAGKTRQKEHG